MKTKIILSLVVLNILVGSLIFFMNPARVEAENALAPAAPAVQPPGPARNVQNADREVFTPADRLEIVRQKEERLAAREAELKELERQVSERIRRLEEIHSAIRNDLAAYRVVSGDRIKHLVKIYSSMKPNAAA
ncbi:MAG TPA: hypothetical protein PLW83_10610, partial [Deltaproteobacteria bacterium]|nr:hypothetical protein [Deltaproteobacteria bacterium]